MADEALKEFRESLRCNRDQQKARFAISSILHRRGEYKKAEDLLTEALGLELWETTRESARRSDLHYNRSCAYCKLAEQSLGDAVVIGSLLEKALLDLKRANVTRSEVSRLTFEEDKRPGGDLSLLATTPAYGEALRRLV
jgi:tetratricopeptide (TPR) repeat protein